MRAEIDNPDGALKPQMFASFNIITSEEASSVAVPESAVVTEGDDARVWVANDDGTLSRSAAVLAWDASTTIWTRSRAV